MNRASRVTRFLSWTSLSALCFLLLACAAHARTDTPDNTAADDSSIADAICPIVYPVDETPSEQGYQYIFYGNAFFINKDGYLITAAHVLSAFRNGGGQPYILVSRPHAPAVLHKADLIAADWTHDVAVLRATPNPFEGKYKVSFLPLSAKPLSPGNAVQAIALRPTRAQDAHTFQAPVHDHLEAQVLEFEFTQEEKGAGDTELLLFDHEVLRGQSGAPVISADTREVIGIVDGRWLRPRPIAVAAHAAPEPAAPVSAATSTSTATTRSSTTATPASIASSNVTAPSKAGGSSVGAAVRIHYAIALLQRQGIDWESLQNVEDAASEPQKTAKDVSIPSPVSVVAAPYPPEALFGGEVILEGLVDRDGQLSDVELVHGDPPFRTKAEDAVQTWSFRPARVEGRPVDSMVAIAFDFAQRYLPSPVQGNRTYPEPQDSDDRAPLPVFTVAPAYPPDTVLEGTVVVLGKVDEQGQLTSTKIISGADPFTSATTTALRQWKFVPGKRGGEPVESAIVVVATFRRPALARVPSSSPVQAQQSTVPAPLANSQSPSRRIQ